MSSLNDDIHDGLTPGFEYPTQTDGDVAPIAAVRNTKPDLFKAIVTNINATGAAAPVADAALFGDTQPGVVPDLSAKIALVDQSRVHVVDLKEVEAGIAGQSSISQEDANHLEQLCGDFFTTRRTVKQFTHAPSKAGLAESTFFLKQRIAKEEAAVLAHLEDFFDKPLEELKVFANHILTSYVPNMRDAILTARVTHEKVLDNLTTSKNTVLPLSGQFINIATTPLFELEPDTFDFQACGFKTHSPERHVMNDFQQAARVIKQLVCGTHLSYFLDMVRTGDDQLTAAWKSRPAVGIRYLPRLCFGDLVELYKNPNLLAALDTLAADVQASVAYFEQRAEEVQNIPQGFDSLNDYLLKHAQGLIDASARVQMLYEVIRSLVFLNAAMAPTFTFLSYCL